LLCCIKGPGYISKNGNSGISNEKIVEKSQKFRENLRWCILAGTALRVHIRVLCI
jgi:hypothetical protein